MAARLFGALDAVMNATGLGILDPATRELRTRYEGVLRARGDSRRLERARAAGRETPLNRLRRSRAPGRGVSQRSGSPLSPVPAAVTCRSRHSRLYGLAYACSRRATSIFFI
jgi:hypothetical protein